MRACVCVHQYIYIYNIFIFIILYLGAASFLGLDVTARGLSAATQVSMPYHESPLFYRILSIISFIYIYPYLSFLSIYLVTSNTICKNYCQCVGIFALVFGLSPFRFKSSQSSQSALLKDIFAAAPFVLVLSATAFLYVTFPPLSYSSSSSGGAAGKQRLVHSFSLSLSLCVCV